MADTRVSNNSPTAPISEPADQDLGTIAFQTSVSFQDVQNALAGKNVAFTFVQDLNDGVVSDTKLTWHVQPTRETLLSWYRAAKAQGASNLDSFDVTIQIDLADYSGFSAEQHIFSADALVTPKPSFGAGARLESAAFFRVSVVVEPSKDGQLATGAALATLAVLAAVGSRGKFSLPVDSPRLEPAGPNVTRVDSYGAAPSVPFNALAPSAVTPVPAAARLSAESAPTQRVVGSTTYVDASGVRAAQVVITPKDNATTGTQTATQTVTPTDQIVADLLSWQQPSLLPVLANKPSTVTTNSQSPIMTSPAPGASWNPSSVWNPDVDVRPGDTQFYEPTATDPDAARGLGATFGAADVGATAPASSINTIFRLAPASRKAANTLTWEQELDRDIKANLKAGRLPYAGIHLSPKPGAVLYTPNEDLRGADFSGEDLRGVNLLGAKLDGCVFYKTRLESANLAGTSLTKADFTGAFLNNADLTSVLQAELVNFTHADLTGATLSGNFYRGTFLETILNGAKCVNADFPAAEFYAAHLIGTDFTGAALDNASFRGTNLLNTVFTEACVSGCNFTGATMSALTLILASGDGRAVIITPNGPRLSVAAFQSTLTQANIALGNLPFAGMRLVIAPGTRVSFPPRTDLRGASFADLIFGPGSDFSACRLDGTNFNGSDCTGGIFRNAILDNASLVNTRFISADLTEASLRNTVLVLTHDGHSPNFIDATLSGVDLIGARVNRLSFSFAQNPDTTVIICPDAIARSLQDLRTIIPGVEEATRVDTIP